MEKDRTETRRIFLKKIKGFQSISFLASDMSKRTYYRVLAEGKSFVLMDAPDLDELVKFLTVQKILEDIKIKAPKIYLEDLQNGFLLIEDFGDITLTKALASDGLKSKEGIYYKQSIHILHDIINRYDEKEHPLPLYGIDDHLKEARVFADYYFLHVRKSEIEQKIMEDWLFLWKEALLRVLPLCPNTLVLRDYHVDNIILLNDESLGVLDFQDALCGSLTYDYISLVEDARRAIDEDLYKNITKDFLSLFDVSLHKDYLQNAAVIGACRHAKILGVFTRYKIMYKNDSKLQYLDHVLTLLINALTRSEEKELLYFLKDQGFTQ